MASLDIDCLIAHEMLKFSCLLVAERIYTLASWLVVVENLLIYFLYCLVIYCCYVVHIKMELLNFDCSGI